MARRYARRSEELDDLVQAGSVGLVKAAARFDTSRGVAFATFAAPTVEGEIRRHLRERGSGVRMPREMQRMSTELRRTRSELAASLGRPPDVRELAAALDADVHEVDRLIAADLARHPIALAADGPAAELPADGEDMAASEYRVLVAGGVRALDRRERRIVFLRFHADMTERQIARTVGISQAHVSRLLEGALTKLRAELTQPTPGDIAENGVISPDPGTNIAPVGKEKGEQNGTVGEPATEAGDTPSPTRRSSRSRASTGYSGRILVRMPSELHEQLAAAAEREDVSLNRYVNEALSSSVEAPDSVPGEEAAAAPEADVRSPAEEAAAAPEADVSPLGQEAAATPEAETRPGRKSPSGLRLALATNLAIVVLAGVVAVVLLVLALQRGI
jgi:RNA polymerase sigma-B factor